MPLDLPVTVVDAGGKTKTTLGAVLTRPHVVSVYMKNATSACDKQLATLAEAAPAIEERGFGVVGLSKDTAPSHQRYIAAQSLSFALLSDKEHAFARAADAMIEKSMYGRKFMGPARFALILGTDGTVLGLIAKVDAPAHGQQVLDVLDAL